MNKTMMINGLTEDETAATASCAGLTPIEASALPAAQQPAAPENLEHMTKQGRRAAPWLGKRSPNARLSDAEVLEVRRLRAEGLSFSRIGLKTGLSKRAVGRLISGETYANV